MKIISESHLDHHLTPAHIEFIRTAYADREGFFVQTVDMPASLDPLPCHLHGPAMGDEPIPEAEVTYARRKDRKGPSRLCHRGPRMTQKLTVIGGPPEPGSTETVLYTAYGGPSAPREPYDVPVIVPSPSPRFGEAAQLIESVMFWREHALSSPSAFSERLVTFQALVHQVASPHHPNVSFQFQFDPRDVNGGAWAAYVEEYGRERAVWTAGGYDTREAALEALIIQFHRDTAATARYLADGAEKLRELLHTLRTAFSIEPEATK